MRAETDRTWNSGWGSVGRLCLAGSVIVNVALGFWLLTPAFHQENVPLDTAPSNAPVVIDARVKVARVNRAEPRSPNLRPAPPFHWDEIESTSYPEYISRLRAIGCPESIVRDIITADIGQHYTARAAQIWSRPKREYWRKSRPADRPAPDQVKQLMQLDAERQDLQKALLGSSTRLQDLINLAFVQLHGPEHELAWLPDDRRAAAIAALEKAGYFAEEEKRMMNSGEGIDRVLERQKKLVQLLESVLTPAELKELTMRSSQDASVLRSELRFFDATQAEFDSLLELREKMASDKSLPKDIYARKEAECAAATEVLGEERAREYERSTDLFYIWSRQAAEHYGLPEQVAEQAWKLKRETMSAADHIRRNDSFTDPEKKQRLTALKDQAGTQLDVILGPQAARLARKGDGVWLQLLNERTQP